MKEPKEDWTEILFVIVEGTAPYWGIALIAAVLYFGSKYGH